MAMRKLGLAVLISGRGSNLQSLIDACKNPEFPAEIKIVISNKIDAAGLEKARAAGVPAETVSHKDYPSREAFEDAVLKVLRRYNVELICLAGFMRILTPHFLDRWQGRSINIHPSLLPDYKGIDTHERVLKDGKTETGCTVHYVVAEMDSGPAIVQKRVPVHPDDTPGSLAARVLEQEHIAYPEAVRLLAMKFLNNTNKVLEPLSGIEFNGLSSKGNIL